MPRAAAVPAEPPAARPAEAGEQRASRAMVLVVDDDAAVCGTTAEILAGLGYTVLQAAGGEASMELLGQGGTVDVLLTDVVMPGVSGPELARGARAVQPLLPIVFISGYADPAGLVGGAGRQPLVRKPFRPAELCDRIEAALSRSRASAA